MITLWENGKIPFYNENSDQIPHIDTYLIESDKPLGAVIIFPGGGYRFLSMDHEGQKTAEFYNAQGFNSFVITYRLAPDYAHPAMLTDALRAIRYVRYHAKEFNINPDQIAILGYSAGGHLAGSLLTHYDFPIDKNDEIDLVSARPDAAILCYGVISLEDKITHMGSKTSLLAPYKGEEYEFLAEFLSSEKQISCDTPPTFLWHTADDGAVPVANSINMAKALSEKKVPFELHIYPHGPHGLGIDPTVPHVKSWAPLSAAWLRDEMKFSFK